MISDSANTLDYHVEYICNRCQMKFYSYQELRDHVCIDPQLSYEIEWPYQGTVTNEIQDVPEVIID